MVWKVLKGRIFRSHGAEGTRLKGTGAVRAAVESGQDGPAGELGLSVELEWLQA